VGILRQFSACFTDYRNSDLIEHTVEELGVWCSWRFVISLSTGHVTMFRWLYIVHFKGTLNSGEAQGESDTAYCWSNELLGCWFRISSHRDNGL
jgi:hypothetical protein